MTATDDKEPRKPRTGRDDPDAAEGQQDEQPAEEYVPAETVPDEPSAPPATESPAGA